MKNTDWNDIIEQYSIIVTEFWDNDKDLTVEHLKLMEEFELCVSRNAPKTAYSILVKLGNL